ncbi:MAG: hypothetical protein ACPL7I_02455 [Myxococcota bacterium]
MVRFMLDAFIIEKLKKEKRRERRREIQLPLYIEDSIPEEESITQKEKRENSNDGKYYERIDIETE